MPTRPAHPQNKNVAHESDHPHGAPSILLAEDDDEMRRLLTSALRHAGYRVIECEDGLSLVDHVRSIEKATTGSAMDLIISDIWLPGMTALELLEGMPRRGTLPPIILITAFGSATMHSRAAKVGAVAMFDKPFDIEDLLRRVRELVPLR
jgi:DNA-binding response OmpR family regulator